MIFLSNVIVFSVSVTSATASFIKNHKVGVPPLFLFCMLYSGCPTRVFRTAKSQINKLPLLVNEADCDSEVGDAPDRSPVVGSQRIFLTIDH